MNHWQSASDVPTEASLSSPEKSVWGKCINKPCTVCAGIMGFINKEIEPQFFFLFFGFVQTT
jgi:hypothetical protein